MKSNEDIWPVRPEAIMEWPTDEMETVELPRSKVAVDTLQHKGAAPILQYDGLRLAGLPVYEEVIPSVVQHPVPSVASVLRNTAHGEKVPEDLAERLATMSPGCRKATLRLIGGRLYYWSTSAEACSGGWLLVPSEKTSGENFITSGLFASLCILFFYVGLPILAFIICALLFA